MRDTYSNVVNNHHPVIPVLLNYFLEKYTIFLKRVIQSTSLFEKSILLSDRNLVNKRCVDII